MIFYNIKPGIPISLSSFDKKEISLLIKEISIEKKYNIMEYIVNTDHIHLVVKCNENERGTIVKTLKSKTTYLYKKNYNIKDRYNLWAQKYNSSLIKSEKELHNVISYVKYNDLKHSE